MLLLAFCYVGVDASWLSLLHFSWLWAQHHAHCRPSRNSRELPAEEAQPLCGPRSTKHLEDSLLRARVVHSLGRAPSREPIPKALPRLCHQLPEQTMSAALKEGYLVLKFSRKSDLPSWTISQCILVFLLLLTNGQMQGFLIVTCWPPLGQFLVLGRLL